MLFALFIVVGIETELAAELAKFAVRVAAMLRATNAAFYQEGTEAGRVVDGNPLARLFLYSVGVHDVCVSSRLGVAGIFHESRHKDGSGWVKAGGV